MVNPSVSMTALEILDPRIFRTISYHFRRIFFGFHPFWVIFLFGVICEIWWIFLGEPHWNGFDSFPIFHRTLSVLADYCSDAVLAEPAVLGGCVFAALTDRLQRDLLSSRVFRKEKTAIFCGDWNRSCTRTRPEELPENCQKKHLSFLQVW